MLTADAATLRREPGHAAAELAHGPVCPDTARRVSCQADITLISLNARGEPVDFGRTRRFFTTTQKTRHRRTRRRHLLLARL